MKKYEVTISSNQVDGHGDAFAKSALEDMVQILNRNYLTWGVEHDPRHPPIGRFGNAWLEDKPNGVILVKAIGELFEPDDILPEEIEKTIVEREHASNQLEIGYDRSYSNSEDEAEINEIAQKFGTIPKFEVKKALEPLSILTFSGCFVLGAIASGFFRQIGADSYIFLKDKLVKLLGRQSEKSKQQLVVFNFTVSHKNEKLLVQTIISSPNEVDIDEFFQQGVYNLDKILPNLFDRRYKLSRLVFMYDSKNGIQFLYAVRKDGFPIGFKKTLSD
jgi:hypothetical protein